MGQLDADWLSVEFASAEAEVQAWGEGLRASLISASQEVDPEADSSTADFAVEPSELGC